MKAVKPYLFWIITGVLLIGELVWIVIDEPSSHLIKRGGVTPVDTRREVDKQVKLLNSLVRRAERTAAIEGALLPERPIAAENKDELDGLVDQFIPHRTWKVDIVEAGDGLKAQADSIRKELSDRTAFLHKRFEVAGTGWFDEYKLVTRELVRRALEKRLYGDGVIPDDIQLEEDGNIRQPLDLYSGQNQPPSNQHESLEFNYRLADLLVDTILGAEAVDLLNPLYVEQVVQDGETPKTFDAAEPGKRPSEVRLQSIKFDRSVSENGIILRPFTVIVEGSPAAALGVGAAIDGMHLGGGPQVVRTGSSFERLQVTDRTKNPLYESRRMQVRYTTRAVLLDYHSVSQN
jgi:hypothetical protein